MAKRAAKVETVQQIMPKLMKSLGLSGEYKARLVIFYWEKIVGEVLAAKVQPQRIEFQTLFLTAKSSSWANQLLYFKQDIVQKVNSFMGERLIKDIRFAAGKGRAEKSTLQAEEKPELSAEMAKIQLSAAQRQEAEEKCASVQDEKLRARLISLYEVKMKREQAGAKLNGHACEKCGVFCLEGEKLCAACERQQRQEREDKVRDILRNLPWVRYADLNRMVPCSPQLANNQRIKLLQSWLRQLPAGDETSLLAKSVVMLYRSLPPEQLNDEIVAKTLYKLRFDIVQGKEFYSPKRYSVYGRKKQVKK